MLRHKDRAVNLKRATCNRFLCSESWEIERRWRTVEILDETLRSELQNLETRRQTRATRLSSIDASRCLIDNTLPQLQKFIKACERKREEISNKQSTHKEFRKLLSDEVHDLTKTREFLSQIRTEMLDRLEGFRAADKYLKAVKKESKGKFRNGKDIIESFKVLQEERKTIFDSIAEENAAINERQIELNDLIENDGQEQIMLLNHLHSIQEQNAKLDEQVRLLQQQFSKVHQLTADKRLNTGKLTLAYYNLYAQLCSKLDPGLYVESASTGKQTALIKLALNEIHKLRDNVHHTVSPRSSIAVASSNLSDEDTGNTTEVKNTKGKCIGSGFLGP